LATYVVEKIQKEIE